MTREELIRICEDAVVPLPQWRNRDTPGAQEQLGLCWVLLKAGCGFRVMTANNSCSDSPCITNDRTLWLEIEWPTFSTFEWGHGHEQDKNFYLPTRQRLEDAKGGDWY